MGSFAFSSSLIQVVFYPEEAKNPEKQNNVRETSVFHHTFGKGRCQQRFLRRFVRVSNTREMQISPMAAWQ